MQLLTFTVAGEPYAIASRRVVEVLPRVPARPLPRVPDYLLGVFTYRGGLVPLVDLARRLGVAPPADRLSTRVIVVECQPADAAEGGPAGSVRLGLVAENVVAIASADAAAASLPPLHDPEAGYLDRILRIGGETVQLIDVSKLLPAELLAGPVAAATAAGDGEVGR
jgi:chemotaxis signal transduction protein